MDSKTLEHIAEAEDAINKVSQAENSMDILYAADRVNREIWVLRRLLESKTQQKVANE